MLPQPVHCRRSSRLVGLVSGAPASSVAYWSMSRITMSTLRLVAGCEANRHTAASTWSRVTMPSLISVTGISYKFP